MLTISLILGELIEEYLRIAARSGRDSRLVVPGLTQTIGREIHEFLCARNVDSFLVVGDTFSPDEHKRWIRPVGLTSKRIGSFAAIISPGQLSQIQDSIRGSGGAIRSLAFSEEWPWIDNGSEAFRFNGLVLDRLVERYSTLRSDQEWIRELILKGLLPCTRTCSWRANLLLEDILGTFEPSLYSTLNDTKNKFLFHAGIPKPHLGIDDINSVIRDSARLCQQINDHRQKEELIREQTRSMVLDVFQDKSERNNIMESLDIFLDGLGRSKNTGLGILSFHSCWGDDRHDPSHWNRLDSSRLADLFGVKELPKAEITFSIKCERGVISRDQKTIATFLGEPIFIPVKYTIPEFEKHTWELRLLSRSRCLIRQSLETAQGTTELKIDTLDNLGNPSRRIPLRLALFADNEDWQTDARISLHLCGGQRQHFILVDPLFDIIDPALESDKEIPDKKFEIDQPVSVYIFNNEPKEPDVRDLDETPVNIVENKSGIFKLSQSLDPSREASGQISIICRFGEKMAHLSFEAKDVEKGEFTLEDELRCRLASSKGGSNEQLVTKLVNLFAGDDQEPYINLGKIDEISRRRIILASQMTSPIGWRPLLTKLISCDYEQSGAVGDFINYLGTVDCSGFQHVTLPDKAVELLRAYSEARNTILNTISSAINHDNLRIEHPIYALHPIFVKKHALQIEQYLTSYLNSYINILNYLCDHYRILEWSQIFVLTYLDCAVQWEEGILKNSLFLIGPWHPLVLGKRFMIQSALFNRGRRLLTGTKGKQFRQLSVLLERIQGFRWMPGLHPDDRLIEPIYASATSDPGWHVAIRTKIGERTSQTENEGLAEICDKLKQNLGLEADLLVRGPDEIVSSCLTSYMRAFPSRRTVSMRIRRGYSAPQILKAVNNLLHTEEGQTDCATQLSGGVSLFFEVCSDTGEDILWADPPLCVYHYSEDTDCFRDQNPNIYVLSPIPLLTFRNGRERFILPRGAGWEAVFSQPLDWLTEGQSLIPKSITYDFDTQSLGSEHLGEAFVTAASRISKFLQEEVSTVRSVSLPQRLMSQWAIAPGGGIDPAVFVKYVRDGAGRSIQERALWDYRLDISEKQNSFYILSTIPKGFSVAVNGFFQEDGIASKFITELGNLGIAIGGEALKSGRHALGVIGLVGAVRLFQGDNHRNGPLKNNTDCVGFLVPIDSFIPFFGHTESIENEWKRGDLLAIQLILPKRNGEKLKIYSCGIESKFVSGTFNLTMAHGALEQAQTSVNRIRDLVETSLLEEEAMPERLGLLELIRFGLRISSPSSPKDISEWISVENIVYESILKRNYEYRESKYGAILVTTEGQFPGVAEANVLPEGLWIRLNRNHWPGVNDTPQLDSIRRQLSGIFNDDDIETKTGDDRLVSIPSHIQETKMDPHSSIDSQEIPNLTQEQIPISENEKSRPTLHEQDTTTGNALHRLLIGVDDGRRFTYFDPQSPVDPLDNLNVMVTGSSGTGKTQLLKYLILQLREQGKEVLILDFKNDFASDAIFAEQAELDRVFVTFDGLPYNPLIPYPVKHPVSGELFVQCAQHISGVTSVLKRTYGLGTQQQADVKNAITAAFESMGIQTIGSVKYKDDMDFPDFASVGGVLKQNNLQAYNRLDPLFTLNLFRQDFHKESFNALVNRSVILDLSQIPSNEIKNALAQLVVMSAHAYYNSQIHSGSIRQMLVFDEAHRVITSEYIAQLVRECRAYGVGTILSSQNPSDFPSEISASMATKIVHGNGRDMDKVKAIVQLLGCEGREADASNLDRFQAFLDNRHYPHTLIRTMNYPIFLIWAYLCQYNEGTREDLSSIKGLDVSKLPLENLIQQLEKLGLVEETGGRIRILSRSR
ncbi:hypothetical protein X793_00435 [Dehalococcoides mccartyi CG4]|uniref:ATP-binding protein n=1 Tax=Dehalococcoides mccartyi TaxID=61435 RepID=UPI0004E052AB|nr:type IV secretion system DNA-binding domain-containing protein [Dehalococcoides mccartyi]AII60156.1 hypothetical protein X793_00435 [Dehalococcoides mccartyi CG4]